MAVCRKQFTTDSDRVFSISIFYVLLSCQLGATRDLNERETKSTETVIPDTDNIQTNQQANRRTDGINPERRETRKRVDNNEIYTHSFCFLSYTFAIQ